MRTWVIIFLLITASFSIASADVIRPLDFLEIPSDVDLEKSETVIVGKIENWGYEKVFFALPGGWEVDGVRRSVKAYTVSRKESLWRIYGMPYDRRSLLGAPDTSRELTGKVFTSSIPVTWRLIEMNTTGGSRQGWWIHPNQVLYIHDLKCTIPTSGGEIDPLAIERDYPYIKVIKWEQEFILTPTGAGFLTAPYTVKGATLTSVSPATYYDKRKGTPSGRYYEDFALESTTPSWKEWFTPTSSAELNFKSLASMEGLEYYPIEKSQVVIPIWKLLGAEEVRYTYEYERGKKLTGITLWRDYLKRIPEWYEWF